MCNCSFPYLVSLGGELNIPSPRGHDTFAIYPRQVFTVPGNTAGVFVRSNYLLRWNTLTGIAWVQHDFLDQPIIPLPDPGQVIQHEGTN